MKETETLHNFVCDPYACGGGVCCKNIGFERRVIIFPEDAHRISKKMRISLSEFLKEYCYNDPMKIGENSNEIDVYYLNNKKNGDCVFLENSLCLIHNYKPKQCVDTPFNFLWTGDLLYECMKNIYVPPEHSTEESDRIVFQSLLKGYQ